MEEKHNCKLSDFKTPKHETESMKGGLWLTAMGRITLDNHNGEVFCKPYDIKILDAEDLTRGISLKDFRRRFREAEKERYIAEALRTKNE